MTHQPETCSVVVSSFDGFQDLWHPFFTLFFRYWPDCPFPVYLISNRKTYSHDRVQTIRVGRDKGWAANMLGALASIPAPYLLYLQDDYFINRQVDTGRIMALLEIASKQRAACLRLYPCPGPDAPCNGHAGLGIITPEAPYRVSLQCAIWDHAVLQTLLVPGESAWEMETRGTRRAAGMDRPFLSITRDSGPDATRTAPLQYVCTAVVKGCWHPDALELGRREGLALNLRKRPLQGRAQPRPVLGVLRAALATMARRWRREA